MVPDALPVSDDLTIHMAVSISRSCTWSLEASALFGIQRIKQTYLLTLLELMED